MSTMINPKYEGEKIAYLDNDFIRKSTALQPLSELEINLLIYMCYKAKENVDIENDAGWTDTIEINMKKFLEGIGYKKLWTDYNHDEKRAMYEALKQMQTKTFEIRTKRHINELASDEYNTVYQSYSYFSYIDYNMSTGILSVSMPKQTQRFLMNYDTGFTPVEFRNMVKLKSKYAKILYLFFRSYRDGVNHTDYTIEHLRQLLGLEDKYPEWYNFKRYILLPAMEEINTKTDILVTGKHDEYQNGLQGRDIKDIPSREYAKIVVDSMARKGEHGKSIYKITFRVSKQDNNIDDKLDFSGLLSSAKKD